MIIRTWALGAIGAATLALSVPASAAVTELHFTAPGAASQIYFVGQNPADHSQLYAGLGADLGLTLSSVTNNGYKWNFAYSLKNVSTIASRVGTIGWDISPDALNASDLSGAYSTASAGNMSFHGPVEFCLKNSNGNNCGGGGNGGPSQGQTSVGTFSLNYRQSVTVYIPVQQPVYGYTGKGRNRVYGIIGYNTVQVSSIVPVAAPRELVFNNFGTHWQSVPIIGSTVGIPGERPLVVIAVPEPATWALMILGFGSVGAMLRRRRTALA